MDLPEHGVVEAALVLRRFSTPGLVSDLRWDPDADGGLRGAHSIMERVALVTVISLGVWVGWAGASEALLRSGPAGCRWAG
eukprot:3226183-Amphidinium_carterae.2